MQANCRSKVESALLNLGEVNESNVDLESHQVELKGNNIDLNKVKNALNEIGYVYKAEST